MPDKDAYTLKEFADANRISLSSVKNLIARGDLVKTYILPGKPVIMADEFNRFRKSRPTERA